MRCECASLRAFPCACPCAATTKCGSSLIGHVARTILGYRIPDYPLTCPPCPSGSDRRQVLHLWKLCAGNDESWSSAITNLPTPNGSRSKFALIGLLVGYVGPLTHCCPLLQAHPLPCPAKVWLLTEPGADLPGIPWEATGQNGEAAIRSLPPWPFSAISSPCMISSSVCSGVRSLIPSKSWYFRAAGAKGRVFCRRFLFRHSTQIVQG